MERTELQTIIVERDAGVVTITLNRPTKKNAITTEMWNELLATLGEVMHAPRRDRVLVLTGAGGAFCAGADLWQAPGEEPRHGLASMRHVGAAVQALHNLPQPTIAKVRGVAVGAGANLALGCDLAVAAGDARFSQIFAKRGLSLDAGGSWILPRQLPLNRAKELAFFGDMISGDDAERMGLINRAMPDAELDGFVADWAARLAAGPPIALAQTKKMLNESSGRGMGAALDIEGASQTVNFGTRDTTEAIAAFADRREPRFNGR